MKLIKTQAEANEACERLRASDFVAIDTEFLRDRTYWAQLCLVQMAGEDEVVALDPVVEPKVLDPFAALLHDESVIKVFHGSRQDLEIFFQLYGRLPMPLFDTQVAAMALGYGDQPGYDRLTEVITGIKISKEQRFTDWAQRPLSAAQLTYAEGDVVPLRQVYSHLRDKLKTDEREGWIEEEMTKLRDTENYTLKPEDAWKRLTLRRRTPEYVGTLIELSLWRERMAQRRNVPRREVLGDDALQDLALTRPSSFDQIANMRSLTRRLQRDPLASELLQAVQEGAEVRAGDLPELPPPRLVAPEGLISLLKALLRARASEFNVSARLIATTDQLTQFALRKDEDSYLMHGWRYKIFGRDAENLRSGKVGFTWSNGAMRPLPTEPPNGNAKA